MIYIFSKALLVLIFPIISIISESMFFDGSPNIDSVSKWFIFWGMGVTSIIAGIKQIYDPSFTLEKIFLIKSKDCDIIVRELGFVNISIGLVGIISLFIPEWRTSAALLSCIFLGLAGIMHLIKQPVSLYEYVALFADLFMFIITALYLIRIVFF